MRVIARSTLAAFWTAHPETKVALERWLKRAKSGQWTSIDDVQRAVPKCKALNGERARFEVVGGSYRLIAAFDFPRRTAFVKFIGTHGEYDRIDALTVSLSEKDR